ncbi:BglG family transcription antiterminator LicT [Anaerostipes sp.]|uniref:BglG family transcription antiterminator LicT n=1 Tax=Anaerostipes sp. TaxID=1872530 RepID=UPI0025C51309|nr:PRD domain-containing protein [Anaerostipes sp.]MBS7009115.1 PRD domain-containing protein [Anaerostipes sp.]
MKIFKALNNNVAVVLDEDGQEKIVMGRGICFKKGAGDDVSPDAIDKTFFLSGPEAHNKFQVLIQDVPMEHIAIGEEIISEAKTRLGKKLNDMVYISLIDHVHTSIVRFLDGVTVKNVLLWDIRRFYRDEYQVGLWALDLIEEKCKVRLPEDEAGFIALHLANAQMDDDTMHNMYEITRIMQEVVNIVKYFFRIEFDEDDVYYYRFVTHLKFFAKRLTEHTAYVEENSDGLWDVIKEKYPDAFRCTEKITQFISGKYEYDLSKEEQLYLTIHIERVINKTKKH